MAWKSLPNIYRGVLIRLYSYYKILIATEYPTMYLIDSYNMILDNNKRFLDALTIYILEISALAIFLK